MLSSNAEPKRRPRRCFSVAALGRSLDAGNRRRAGHRHDRLAVGADHRRRHGLGIGAGIGCFEVDDVAQEDLSLIELVAPIQVRARRALRALGEASTSQISEWAHLRGGSRRRTDYTRRVLDRIAVKIGRASTRGSPWLWKLPDPGA